MSDLFSGPHARPGDPITSHEAAASIKMTEQAIKVLKAYVNGKAMIDHDAYMLAGFGPNARDGQRCSDLRTAGLIERTGDLGRTPSGKSAYKCRITAKGLKFLDDRRAPKGLFDDD